MTNKESTALSVVILAAGSSTRMNAENASDATRINKQFINIGGIPIIIHTLKCFERLDFVKEIIVVTSSKDIEAAKKVISEYKINKITDVILGGDVRQESSYKALSRGLKCPYAAIHDGARPFVGSDLIENTFENAVKFGAAAPAVKVKDTLKEIDEYGFVTATPPRNLYRQIQTPQIFETELVLKAHKSAKEQGYIGTDDCSLIERIGRKVKLTEGSYNNIKVTTPEDIPIAEAIYNALQLSKNGG